MIRFTTTVLLLIILFLSGVLLGMNQASLGIIEMRGFSNDSLQEAVKTNPSKGSSYEVEVLGQGFEQVSVEEKQKAYAEMQTDHGVQKLAFALEKAVKWVYNTIIFIVYQFVQIFYS
ncbi:DUF3679 domain-containing protein [Pontibacillus salicampi]|uniref:DUF3679 domain-containing protein n=1 Tax=Pontibacillus salicampi TaxID=1449801 RepID=A0ABV6LJI8_9BACI